MNSSDVLIKLADDIRKRKNVALVSIIASYGSVPRDSGSKMLVYEDGSIYGSVGGGILEKKCIEAAIKCLKKGENLKREFLLDEKHLDALCMGKVEVYIEIYKTPFRVIILGGGHVAIALSKILSFLSIPYVVCDDRKDLANKENFPDAIKILNILPYNFFKSEKVNSNDYIVIVTRGHKFDKECLIQAIKTNASYIGMIGSVAKVKEIYKNLSKKGIDVSKDKRVFSPIGINTGGKTPSEIAISIAAEILSVFYKTKPSHLRESIW